MENLIKPKLLDLYCCGGGAGRGYELAGFDVTGVDNVPQPKHRGKFTLADAIEYVLQHGQEFDFIHASPPCQANSLASMQHRKAGKIYPDLIGKTRDVKQGWDVWGNEAEGSVNLEQYGSH